MQEDERKAFEAILAEIFASIDKPLGEAQRNAFWRGLKDLSIMEFSRIAEFLVHEYREYEEPPRKFTLGDIWRARKKMRAAAAPQLQEAPKWAGDVWDQVANNQLRRHIHTSIARDTNCYGRGATAKGMQASTDRNADASPQFVRAINTLVAFKNRWAQLMRESADSEGVPWREQRQSWDLCMRTAEETISAE